MVDSPATPPDDADAAAATGPRRSTYVPPGADDAHPEPATATPASPSDALADAISAEYRAWVPVDRQPPPAAPASADFRPGTPVENPLAGLSSPQAVPPGPPGPSIPPPPERASLPDDALLAVLDPDRAGGDTAALIDLFQEQLTLREREARLLDAWEEEVRRTGTSEADAIVTQVRSAYTGVIDVIPPPLAPAPGEVDGADSAPTGPGQAVTPPPVVSASPTIDPATLTGDALGDALADAPPPDSAQRTVATPPDELVADAEAEGEAPRPAVLASETGPVPPPLVEPEPPTGSPESALGSTDWEALLSAAPPSADAVVASATPPPVSDSAPSGSPASSSPASPPEPRPAAPAPTAVAARSTARTEDTAPPLPTGPAPARGPRAFAIEQSALEPTPEALRAGRGVRQFWLWFAVNASVVTLALGALIVAEGASLRQAALAALAGVALSAFLLGVVTRTGRWSGQPTIVVGRATFGTSGNLVPTIIAVLVRVLWTAALLAILAFGVTEVLVEARLDGGLNRESLVVIVGAVGAVVAIAAAVAGFGLIARMGAVIAPVSAVLVVGLIALTAPSVDLAAALGRPDGSWALLVGGAVLVVSAIGLAWVSSGGDLVRYQARASSGASAAVWASLGVALPAFALVAWGALLAASSPAIGAGLVQNPVDTIARLLPLWYPVPLAIAVALSLIMGAALSIYSGAFAVLALGAPAPRLVGVGVVGVLAAGALAALLVAGSGVDGLLRDALLTLAVPVAAWAGIVGTETLLRRRPVHAVSLLQAGGVYPAVRWIPLGGLIVASAVGFGLVDGGTALLGWAGFLWPLLGAGEWASSDAGVLVALLLGAVTAAASIPELRRLQAAESGVAA